MCKSEIFAETINLVSQETEIPVNRILSSDKDTETVDARYLLVRLLVGKGHVSVSNSLTNPQDQACDKLHDFQFPGAHGRWENVENILGKYKEVVGKQLISCQIAYLYFCCAVDIDRN